jgi:hypothetical protein
VIIAKAIVARRRLNEARMCESMDKKTDTRRASAGRTGANREVADSDFGSAQWSQALPGIKQPKEKFAASTLVLAAQAFITNNAQITASTEAENFLNESQQYLDNVGDIRDVARTIFRITTEMHPQVMRVYADDPNRRFILSGGTFLLGLAAACNYIRNRNKMKTLDIALDRLSNELKKINDDPWNLTSYQQALAMITTSRGKATRRLVYDTFLRFFAGATSELEWLDTAAQITGATS